jgi:hypothetical protein
MNEDLEEKFLYRLIRVFYVGSFLLAILFSVVMAWSSKPRKLIDHNNSYIVCSGSGSSFSLSNADIYMFNHESSLDNYDNEKARKLCYKSLPVINSPSLWSGYYNYDLYLIDKTEGSWVSVMVSLLLTMSVSYIILNILKETLIYILFGKSFDWQWLIVLMDFFSETEGKKRAISYKQKLEIDKLKDKKGIPLLIAIAVIIAGMFIVLYLLGEL